MLTFRMDETNFAEGQRDGVRIVTGVGLKADFDEFAGDGNTIGLWHLHDGACQGEGTGLTDASGGGHHLENHGAASAEDGYRFAHTDSDYMQAPFPSQPARSQATLECWVRDYGVPPQTDWAYRRVACLYRDTSNYLEIVAHRHNPPTSSAIWGRLVVGGAAVGSTVWSGATVDALLAQAQPWHVALVLDSPNVLRLFVNGVQHTPDTTGITALPSGDYTLFLGIFGALQASTALSAVLDEVRLSASARYAAGFPPHRLLAEGTYTGPTFDAVRLTADWADLVRTQTVPQGCGTAWDVRAADETDAGGEPQALWQPYAGDPQALPDGRYFQWRATLSTSGDRLTSPTIERVDALASEAGYNVYHAMGPGPESLDYAEPCSRVGPTVTQVPTAPLDTGTIHWFGIRPVDADGNESPTSQGEVRIEINAQGGREPDRPAGALAPSARPLPLGVVRLGWRYRVGHSGVLPQAFRVFGDGGTGTIDYETPLGEVGYAEGVSWYAWTSDPLAPGVEHQLAVRAVTVGGVWDEQPAVALVTPDATPPAEVDALQAEVTP